jgi:hypothetical protein
MFASWLQVVNPVLNNNLDGLFLLVILISQFASQCLKSATDSIKL